MSDTLQETLTFDKHNNILIVASGATNYALKEIRHITSFKDMLRLYGESKLTEAYALAKQIGVESIFVSNIQTKDDFIDVANIASDYDFAFIVCPDIMIDDSFIDSNDASYKHNYFAYTLGNIGINKLSTIIASGKHASLYETIDDFNTYMNDSYDLFRRCCSENANLENIIIVANNLVNNEMADVILASLLATTSPGTYPTSDILGEAIFHLDAWDYPLYVYFKSHSVRETTVENLLNCRFTRDTEKIVTISMIKKYIERILDFSDYMGMQYSEYKKQKIQEKLEQFLDSIVGILIKEWAVVSINVYKSGKGTIVIVVNFEIVPINSIEKIHISKEVEV